MEKLIRAPDDFFTEAQKAEDTYLTPDDFFTEASTWLVCRGQDLT